MKSAAGERAAGVLGWIERRLGITPTGVAALALCAGGLAIGRALRTPALFLLVYGGLLVVASAWMLGRRQPSIEAERSNLPRRVRVGQVVAVSFRFATRRRASTIVLEEELHDPLGSPVRVPVPLLTPGEHVAHGYTFVPGRRGVYDVGPLVAEWSDPFGFTRRRMVLAEKVELLVHPSTELVHDRVTSREWEDPPIRPPVSKPWPTGFEFYGMRDYVSGDDPRRIVWRAVAQHDRYLVRESEQGITDRVNLLLDSARGSHSSGPVSETFELAVRVAASLGTKHLDDGFGVTLDVNSARVGRLFRGRRDRIPMLDELARVELESEPFTRALERLIIDPRRNAHNVVITHHLERDTASRMRLLRDRGVGFLLVHIVSDTTDAVSLHRAAALGSAVVEVRQGMSLDPVFRHVVGAGRS